MPKITILLAQAASFPSHMACRNIAGCFIKWSEANKSTRPSGSSSDTFSEAIAAAAAVLRPSSSKMIAVGAMLSSASCSLTMKRCSELQMIIGFLYPA